MKVAVINYSSPHTTLQMFGLMTVYYWVTDIHIRASALRLYYVLCFSVCLCANETAGSHLNKIFPPIRALLCPPCLLALFVCHFCLYGQPWQKYACLTTNSSGRVCYMRWIQAPPLFCVLYPPTRFFTPALRCDIKEEGGGCLRGWGCNCTPSDGVSGLGSLGSGEGEVRRKRKTDVKEWTAPSGRVAMDTGETDEWMTSQWRGGERVWNWFGGGARGGGSRWVFVGQTHFSLLCTLVSPVDGLLPVRLCFFSIPPFSLEDDGECKCDFRSDNCLQVLTTCETDIAREDMCVLMCMDVMWCSRHATGNERKGRCAVQLSRV